MLTELLVLRAVDDPDAVTRRHAETVPRFEGELRRGTARHLLLLALPQFHPASDDLVRLASHVERPVAGGEALRPDDARPGPQLVPPGTFVEDALVRHFPASGPPNALRTLRVRAERGRNRMSRR